MSLLRYLLFIAIACLSYGECFSQSFPWFGGEREPYQIPTIYTGGSVGFSSLNTSEDLSSIVPDSEASYSNGFVGANVIHIDAVAEYWIEADQTLRLSLGAGIRNIQTERNFTEPVAPERNWDQISKIDINGYLLDVEVFYKRRLFAYLSGIVGIGNQFTLTENVTHTLESLDPQLLYYETDRSIDIASTSVENISGYMTSLSAGLNYDYPIAKGIYLSPTVTVGYNWGWSSESVSFLQLKAGMAVLLGVN